MNMNLLGKPFAGVSCVLQLKSVLRERQCNMYNAEGSHKEYVCRKKLIRLKLHSAIGKRFTSEHCLGYDSHGQKVAGEGCKSL